ncbi:MAG: MFS transporter [Cyanobacteria bacterium M_surface_9_m1_291]|nr:MFS transporter [Cyanobacteria bacterium M_surface_9_m1_291]
MPLDAEDAQASPIGRLLSSARSLWQLRVFRRFLVANLVSNLGTSAFVMALSWLTVKTYGSSGIAALALGYGVPQFLLNVVGGAAADRISRRRLFQLTETGFLLVALTLWLVSIGGTVPLWLLVAVNACNGAISAFDSPARTALISEMVPQHQWMEAQQLSNASYNLTNIFGPALGGVLLSIGTSNRSHEEVAFFFNVLSFLPLLILIPFLPSPRAATHAARSKGESFLRSVAEGLQFVRGQWSLRSLLQLLAVVMLLGMPFQTLLPIFVHSHPSMGGGQSHGYYAALLSAVALGGFVGALLGMASSSGRRPGGSLLAAAVGLGLSIVLLASSVVIHWASLAAFFAGACGVLAVNLDTALVEGFTPVALQGRVSAIASLSKGLQSFSAAAASGLMHGVALLTGVPGSGYWPVQVSMGVALILVVFLLRGPLLALEARAASASA